MTEAQRDWLAALLLTVQSLAATRAREMLSGLTAGWQTLAQEQLAAVAALGRAERHARLAGLVEGGLPPGELAGRMLRLPPSLRRAVLLQLAPGRTRRSPDADRACPSGPEAGWGARLAREWSSERPRAVASPSPARDAGRALRPAASRWPIS